MRSDLIEYSRFNQLDTGVLGMGNAYLRARASEPILEVKSPFDHEQLLRTLGKLRYKSELSEDAKWKLIQTLSDDIKAFFIGAETVIESPVQWDLVFNAAELGLIPFEAMLNDDGIPAFACENPKIILTRRIRQRNLPALKENWPVVPRVLFAYADSAMEGLEAVPYYEHISSLRRSLRPWLTSEMMEQSDNDVLTILANVRFTQIEDALVKAIRANKPYTHLHVLAHGVKIELPDGLGYEFGVGLFKVATIDDFSDLFEKLQVKPFVVSYMICDSANASNAIISKKNIVQATHRAGVPVVIGSQLPLTFPGSVCIADRFYEAILNGEDVRNAVHLTRCALFSGKGMGHDWLSFIAYVRLPEGYENSLQESRLKREMQSLITIHRDTERLVRDNAAARAGYQDMFDILKERLHILLGDFSAYMKTGHVRAELMEENAGMIGSCYKRLAELIFYRDRNSATDIASRNEQLAYLMEALSWYRQAADHNLSHHWSVVQYLSLDRIINQGKASARYESAAALAITNAVARGDKIWANGSQVELYLLSTDERWPLVADLAFEAMENFVREAKLTDHTASYLSSITLQLSRYVKWWIPENGYNDQSRIPLSNRARELLNVCQEEMTRTIISDRTD